MNMKIDLDNIRVASPCNARWNDMAGDERARFCGQCSKNVFNLSAMTRAQIESLIREKEGKFCGRFYRRPDGRMLTADCPSRWRQLRARVARVGGALCALVFSVLGCSPRDNQTRHGTKMGRMVMGDVAVQPVVCASNNIPATMGLVALPEPVTTPGTNPPVLMGEIHVEPKPDRSATAE